MQGNKYNLVKGYLKKEKLDYIILNKEDLRYFIGYESEGMLVLDKNKITLYTNKLDAVKFSNKKELTGEIITKLLKNKRVGINFQKVGIGFSKFLTKKPIDISLFINSLRSIKSNNEISKIRVACKYADNCFNKIVTDFNFRNEKDIDYFIRRFALDNDIKVSFEPIVAFGKNSSNPHYKNNNARLGNGFLKLDFGFIYKGYCSDFTRTIHLGKPTEFEKENYQKVQEIQKKIIDDLKIGEKYSKYNDITKKALGNNFIHSLGHGLGLEVHESPGIHSKSRDIVTAGNAITIEPGIYFKNKFGIRIEDDILIKKNKIETLTKSNKELIII